MKKLLLATAAFALVSGVAHAEIKLDLGGYFKGYAGYSDQDTDNLRKFDIARKSQIYFDGETTLDNGLTVGYHGELFQENTTGVDQLQESYLYFSGNWGRFNLGRSNGAGYLLQVSAPGADSNIDGQDISMSFYNPSFESELQDYKQAGQEDFSGNSDTQYADKITYLTPKFNGFQGGISYSPSLDQKVVGDSTSGMETSNDTFDLQNSIEGAIRYDGIFSGVGVHIGGGYDHAYAETVNPPGNFGSDSWHEWNVGAKFTYDNVGVGAAYNRDNEAGFGPSVAWTTGADYTWGAYVFGASFFRSSTYEGTAALGVNLDRYTVGANYTFGPGMQFRGAVAYYNEDLNASAATPENDATVVTLGTDIQF